MAPMSIAPRISNKIANMSLVCAILVVGLHCKADFVQGSMVLFAWKILVQVFGAIAVPFFFVISGFLLAGHMHEKKWWVRENLKRIRTLLVPYVCSCIVFIALEFGLKLLANITSHQDLWRNFDFSCGYWLQAFGVDLRFNPINAPLWYVRALLVLVGLSFFVKRLAIGVGVSLLLFLYVVSCFCFIRIDNDNWVCRECLVSLDAVKALFYFTSGVFLRLRAGFLFSHFHRPLIYSLTVGLFVALVFLLLNESPYFGRACWLFVPFGGCVIFDLMPSRKWPSELTSLSFPIYIFHTAIIQVVGVILRESAPFVAEAMKRSMSVWSLYYLTVVLITVLVVVFVRRFAPRMAGVLFGGR